MKRAVDARWTELRGRRAALERLRGARRERQTARDGGRRARAHAEVPLVGRAVAHADARPSTGRARGLCVGVRLVRRRVGRGIGRGVRLGGVRGRVRRGCAVVPAARRDGKRSDEWHTKEKGTHGAAHEHLSCHHTFETDPRELRRANRFAPRVTMTGVSRLVEPVTARRRARRTPRSRARPLRPRRSPRSGATCRRSAPLLRSSPDRRAPWRTRPCTRPCAPDRA